MASIMYNAILLFGAPGSGKGTQGKILGAIPGFYHSATGDLFRALDMNSDMGKMVKGYSSRGELVPDDFTIKLWTQHMAALVASKRLDPQSIMLLMDGVPRNPAQAKLLEPLVRVHRIIHLVCSDLDQMVQRMRLRAIKENRMDDADEKVIRHRFEVYEKETRPVLEHYTQDKIIRIEAGNSIMQVLQDILAALTPLKEAFDLTQEC